MAGTYPDLPAPRIEYDRDGTRVYRIIGSAVTELTGTPLAALNDETSGSYLDYSDPTADFSILFVFPERRDISHAFLHSARGAADSRNMVAKIQWSNDSTTGLDGTWTTAVADFPENISTNPRYRSDIVAVAGVADVRMVKWSFSNQYFDRIATVHMYGKATAGQNLHRLRLWHPTLDEPLDNHPAHLDWGNIPQESNATRQFRVKNDSPNLTAAGIKVFLQALFEANPTQVSQHTLSLDGVTFVPSAAPGLAIGTLPAQQISGIIHLKRTTLVNAQLGLWRQRVVAAADTWS